jgi:ATP-dependent DNA ligase
VFRAACNMGLEGVVAKRRDSRYRSGRSRDWIRSRTFPAIERAMLIALSKRGKRNGASPLSASRSNRAGRARRAKGPKRHWV